VAVTATVLTNAYYLRFLEPQVSRRWVAAIVVVAAAAALALAEWGAPRGRAAWRSLAGVTAQPALLAVVLAVAFGLRAWGARAGLPQSYVSDEYEFVHDALRMMKGGDLNPHAWYHPSLQPYLALATYTVVFLLEVPQGRWVQVKQVAEEDMLYWGRFVGVLSGTVTVFVTFLLGRRLFGPRVGLLAAALLAVFPAAVEHSQYNKPDPVLALMTTLSVLVSLVYLEGGGRARALAAGLVIGLTLSAKYNGIVVVVPFLLAVAFRLGSQLLTRPDLYLGGLGVVAGFFLGCPLFLANFQLFLDHVADDIHAYAAGRPGSEGVDNWANHAAYIARDGTGFLPAVAGVAGLGLVLSRMNARLAVFLSFPVLYYGYYSAQRINFRPNLLPLYPFLAVLGAYAVQELVGWLRPRWRRSPMVAPLATAALLTALLGPPLLAAVRYDIESTRRDTGSFAREWIERTVPPGTRFALERFTPVLDRSRYPVTQEARLITRSVRSYRDEGVEYLVVSSLAYDRFGPEHNQSRSYQKLFAICPLVAEFAPIPGQRPGPTIRILRVPSEEPAAAPGTVR
jgi:4-amino-4-deoxy-L-arabinose transferase-like glycosyltransferase